MARTEGQANVTTIEVEGIIYTMTRPGYYYKKTAEGQKRIPKAEWEVAFDAYINTVDEADEEQDEFDVAYEGRQEMAREEEHRQAENDKQTEAEVNKKHAEKKPAAKKRASKNVFHTSVAVPGVTLTDKQVSFMLHFPDTCFWEHRLDSTLWIDVLVDEIGGEFTEKPMTVGAMISTLREKGLLRVNFGQYGGGIEGKGRKAKYIELTENGKKVAQELGLK